MTDKVIVINACRNWLKKKQSFGMEFKLLPKYQPNKARKFSQLPASFGSFLKYFPVWALVSPHREEGFAFGTNLIGSALHMGIMCYAHMNVLWVMDIMHLLVNGLSWWLVPGSRQKSLLQCYFKHFYQNKLFVMFLSTEHHALSTPCSSIKRWSHPSQTSEACCTRHKMKTT